MLKVVLRAPFARNNTHISPFPFRAHASFGTMSAPGVSQNVTFTVAALDTSNSDSSARLGKLTLKGRRAIDTPNFLAVASRGVVPHITPDVISQHTSIGGVHMALEDCKYAALWVRSVHIGAFFSETKANIFGQLLKNRQKVRRQS
jgi:hypothetical protein